MVSSNGQLTENPIEEPVNSIAKPQNTASIRVTQRLGMVPLGRTSRYYGTELELFKLEAIVW
ncbi:MAG TPA: hypothetical protein V6C85_11030 [Allocoleopsis sp.]